MSKYLTDINPLILTKTNFFLPINETQKRNNSAIFLLTPNIQSSINLMNNRLFINKTFNSYYIERNISFIINENFKVENDYDIVLEDYSIINDKNTINEDFMTCDNTKIFFPDSTESIIKEAKAFTGKDYSASLRKLLYNERIKSQKEIVAIYDKIKESCKDIKYTYFNYPLYKEKNLFIDWSYYTESFFKNNIYKRDKGLDVYLTFINKFIKDKRLDENNYKLKTVFVPVNDWNTNKDAVLWDYTNNINPISLIYRLIRLKSERLKTDWKDIDFVFITDKAYFKVSFNDFDKTQLSKFTTLLSKLITNNVNDAELDTIDSDKVIVTKVIDKIENTGVKINNIAGTKSAAPTTLVQYKQNTIDQDKQTTDSKTDSLEPNKKDKLVDTVINKTKGSIDVDQALSKLDDTITKKLIIDLQSEDGPNIDKARRMRMNELNSAFLSSTLDNIKIEDLINKNTPDLELKPDTIPIDNINEEWKNIKFTSFNKEYDVYSDIMASISNLQDKSVPVSVVDYTIEDGSTSEDYVDILTVKLEDINGKRFTIKLDIPKFINNRFMKLRGNIKTINGQLILLPIIKTDEDTAQIVSSYNKIFIKRVNPSNGTKTTRSESELIKALDKYNGSGLTIYEGDNSFICSKYEVPIEYRDLSSNYSKILMKNGAYISFNLDEMYELKSKIDPKQNNYLLPIGYYPTSKKIIYSNEKIADIIINILINDDEFKEIYKSVSPNKKLSYTEASILSTKIPVIVVMAYNEGLQSAMQKAGIKFEVTEKRTLASEEPYIKFNDGYIVYSDYSIADSILMNGLQDCNTEDYSIKDMNKKDMWLDFLDNFGGRIKADGLDNFYDCMFDPMTVSICKQYNLPYDYVTALGYASDLLADTKYNRHTDISGNRVRTNEIIAGYFYKVLSKAYGDYKNQLKRNKKDATISIKQSAVVDAILVDNTCQDLSILNPLLEAEANNTLSFKGLSGMNSDRSYSLDKRVYNDSMLGVLAMSTGFSANVGITRQATVNCNIEGARGMVNTPKKEDVNTLNCLSIYEALTPYGTTHDDPIRTAMGFIQTTKHQMRVKRSSPNLITYGMDEALPYMTSDIFSYKFKGYKGKVIEITDDYIIFEETYLDKTNKLDVPNRYFVSLKDNVMKNSDGGFFVTVKLDSNVKVGQILSYNDIIAYDKSSFSKARSTAIKDNQISYNIGTLSKIAIMCTDEAYEDSSIISDRLSDDLTSTYCVKKDRSLSKDTNIYNLVLPGTPIQEGDPLLVFQNAFDEKDANALLKSITDDDLEAVSDLGRIQLRSKLTGVVQDIKIYRTCEIADLSPSLKKIVTKYEKKIKEQKDIYKKYNIAKGNEDIEPDYKLEPIGKLKGTIDGVLIEFYIKCEDKMGIGDKLVYNNAIKGVIKDIIPKGKEPYTDFRKDEPIDALLTNASVNARMVSSIITSGALNKILVELDRKCKDLLGIKWKNLQDM